MSFRRISVTLAVMVLCGTLAVGVARAQGSRSVSDFSLKNTANAAVSLKSYAGKKAVAVVFVNPACAFSKLYQNRLTALSSAYSGRGVQFLFINTPINLEGNAAAAAGNEFPYLTDESQQVSTLLGATKTPEVVVLQPAGDDFMIRYRGAIDDNPQVENFVKERYLADALDAVLAGRTPTGDKRAAGCLIKKF